MSSIFSVSWCVLCGVKVLRGGWNGLPALIDVCGYNLAERSGRMGCVGRSELFGWLRTSAHLLQYGGVLTGIAVLLIYLICWRSPKPRCRNGLKLNIFHACSVQKPAALRRHTNTLLNSEYYDSICYLVTAWTSPIPQPYHPLTALPIKET